jgi:hypothetical protein
MCKYIEIKHENCTGRNKNRSKGEGGEGCRIDPQAEIDIVSADHLKHTQPRSSSL